MKILYIDQNFSTPDGAAGIRPYEVARHFIQRGHEVTMICGTDVLGVTGLTSTPRRGVRRGRIDGIDVIEIVAPYSNYFGMLRRTAVFAYFALRCTVVAWRAPYDVLFASSTPLTVALPGILMRLLRPRRKFVLEVRDLWPELPRALGMKNVFFLGAMSVLEKLAYMTMHGGIALAPGILSGMRRRSPAATPIVLIPQTSNCSLFGPRRRADTQAPATGTGTGADGGTDTSRAAPITCVYAGAFGFANQVSSIVDAARVLHDRGRDDIRILLVGEGVDRPKLVERVANEGLRNCEFVPLMPKHELAALLATADLGILALRNIEAFYYGTAPRKFFDYLAAGLPILTNHPGWVADMLTEHRCGLAVKPDDPVGFADALSWAADHRGELAAMGRNARRLAETEFESSKICGRVVGFVEDIVAGRTPHGSTA